jgi:hypothetical protein
MTLHWPVYVRGVYSEDEINAALRRVYVQSYMHVASG